MPGEEEFIEKTRHPIGLKLMSIISKHLLVSLRVIAVLAPVMVSSDVRIAAEGDNHSINSRQRRRRKAVSAGKIIKHTA
jgi:hypothetical protein